MVEVYGGLSKRYHLVGIGGIGMSGIAGLLLCRKVRVSGSDLKETKITQGLKRAGAEIYLGHSSSNVAGADSVIYSSAIKEDNPEIQEAKRRGIPCIKRAQALVGLMQEKIVITVSGSHGKTTTTSLVSYLLLKAGLFPTVAIGGILRNIDANACMGEGRFFVAEADESDGSFLYYQPRYSIVTNIDREHLDYYSDFANEVNAFRQFLHKTDLEGCIFCCSDDNNLRDIAAAHKGRHILFGLDKDKAHIYPKDIKMGILSCEFDCFYKDKFIDRFLLALGGRHNISNALSVIALGIELGIDVKLIKEALSGYQGARRRLEVKYNGNNYLIIDDYAHHPTEIRATLEAIRNLNKRVIAVFQPHRYSRTKLLLDDFGKSFGLADVVMVTDIYPASESPLPGVNARVLCDKIIENSPRGKEVRFVVKENIVPEISGIIRKHDIIITLGAGDIVKVCDELVETIKRKG